MTTRRRSRGASSRWSRAAAWLKEPLTFSRWGTGLTLFGFLAVVAILLLAQRRQSAHVDLDAIPQFPECAEALATMTGGVLVPGNAVRVAENGAFFHELSADIGAATLEVHLETYIWAKGSVSDEVGGALVEAARRGVKVRVVMDAVGGHEGIEVLDRLREAGGEVVQYRPMGIGTWQSQNYRGHRKLVVIDGRIAWVMGHGFADEWAGDGEDAEHWRDTGVRIEGPVVPTLQAEFLRSWLSASGEGFVEPESSRAQPPRGDVAVHVVSSSSGERISTVAILFESALRAARHDVVITTPYFAPSDRILDAMRDAASRGVRVRLLVPGEPTDSWPVRHATHAELQRLFDAGARVWEHPRTMVHQKIMVVDGLWSHVGSTNMDMRSLEMSDELSVGLLDPATAARLTSSFESDLSRAQELTPAWLEDRSLRERALDWAAHLSRKQL